jgi:hypothetical protein
MGTTGTGADEVAQTIPAEAAGTAQAAARASGPTATCSGTVTLMARSRSSGHLALMIVCPMTLSSASKQDVPLGRLLAPCRLLGIADVQVEHVASGVVGGV